MGGQSSPSLAESAFFSFSLSVECANDVFIYGVVFSAPFNLCGNDTVPVQCRESPKYIEGVLCCRWTECAVPKCSVLLWLMMLMLFCCIRCQTVPRGLILTVCPFVLCLVAPSLHIAPSLSLS